MRRNPTALLLLAILVVGSTQAATAARSPILVVGFSKIGTFEVDGGNPVLARKAFGAPKKITDVDQSCLFTWPGVQIDFYTLVYKDQCGARSAFSNATITRPWVTERGLRQGDPVAKAKRLYPQARKAGRNLGVGGVGLIIKTFAAIGDYGLSAGVKNGRMTSLFIFYPQGGE